MSDLPNIWQDVHDTPDQWAHFDARISGGATVKSEGPRTLVLATPAGWTTQAACIGQWELFEGRPDSRDTARAVAICEQCPVRAICLDAAVREEWTIGRSDFVGVRGGLTARSRYKYRQQIKSAEKRAQHTPRGAESTIGKASTVA